MKDFRRQYPLFSLCGLNCGLCPMLLGNYCPGCGGGAGNQPCAIARCSQKREGLEYCYQCGEYPCEKYEGIDVFDSFIVHRNQLKDFERVKTIGIDAYKSELEEKVEILHYLLADFNDGRRKNFFYSAVNLLELQDVKTGMAQLDAGDLDGMTLKEKAALAVNLFGAMAEKRSIVLKLNKKTEKGQ